MSTTAAGAATTLTVPCTTCGKWNRVSAERVRSGPRCGSCKSPLALDHPIPLTDATFDRVIAENASIPVLVDFYADWCGPCKMMAPAVEQLARESAGTAIVAKLDTEAAQRTAGRFRITGIPTTIVLRAGREVKRQVGAVNLAMLRSLLA